VVASSRPLEQDVASGRFRSDLYYRLNVVGLYLPPLRERPPAVIEAIAHQFLTQLTLPGSRRLRLAYLARLALVRYSWPGNVRELRNVIERAVTLADGERLILEDLPAAFHTAALVDESGERPTPFETDPVVTATTLKQTKHDAEAIHISETLHRCNHNRLRAAAELGISRMTLYRKLRLYGLNGCGR
jgi:transcriptional regulator with PAS, ATPase and Fis domain